MTIRLAFAGFKLSGKTTCARHVRELLDSEYTYYLHFKDGLINIIAEGCDSIGAEWCVADFGDEKTAKGRDLLVALGAYLRAKDPAVLIKLLEARLRNIDDGASVVVDGCRFKNEAMMLRKHGFKIVKIERPGYGSDGTATEKEQAGIAADYTIRNDKGLGELRDGVAAIVRAVQGEG